MTCYRDHLVAKIFARMISKLEVLSTFGRAVVITVILLKSRKHCPKTLTAHEPRVCSKYSGYLIVVRRNWSGGIKTLVYKSHKYRLFSTSHFLSNLLH